MCVRDVMPSHRSDCELICGRVVLSTFKKKEHTFYLQSFCLGGVGWVFFFCLRNFCSHTKFQLGYLQHYLYIVSPNSEIVTVVRSNLQKTQLTRTVKLSVKLRPTNLQFLGERVFCTILVCFYNSTRDNTRFCGFF